jgi:hypothetical protein
MQKINLIGASIHSSHCCRRTAQILPQLLFFLRVEQRAEAAGRDPKHAMDWATLAIYTCSASCDASSSATSAYVDEFVYRQPPADY